MFAESGLVDSADVVPFCTCLQNNIVDWRVSGTSTIRSSFMTQINSKYNSNTAPYWNLPAVSTPAATAAAAAASSDAVSSAAVSPRARFALNRYTIVVRPRPVLWSVIKEMVCGDLLPGAVVVTERRGTVVCHYRRQHLHTVTVTDSVSGGNLGRFV